MNKDESIVMMIATTGSVFLLLFTFIIMAIYVGVQKKEKQSNATSYSVGCLFAPIALFLMSIGGVMFLLLLPVVFLAAYITKDKDLFNGAMTGLTFLIVLVVLGGGCFFALSSISGI